MLQLTEFYRHVQIYINPNSIESIFPLHNGGTELTMETGTHWVVVEDAKLIHEMVASHVDRKNQDG